MTLTILIALAVSAVAQAESADDEMRKMEVELWRKAFSRQAKEYRIATVAEPDKPFKLVEKPVFLWSQPVRFNQSGSVFIWLQADGRPGVIGTLYSWKSWQEKWALSHEFHSLAPVPLQTVWRHKTIWTPTEPGLKWRILPHAPPPSKSTRMQTRQMRLLARKFQAHTLDRNGDRWELRLLSKPLHAYTVHERDATVTGGLFAMCQGLDPELLLAIEFRPAADGGKWYFACGAFTDYELHVQFEGEEVWSTPITPTADNPQKVYWRCRITSLAPLPRETIEPGSK